MNPVYLPALKLRTAAEARLACIRADQSSGLTPDQILRELQVHQIEMEMQNQSLRDALVALEGSRDRYAELFEFAPVSFITLSALAQVSEANLTAANFLGVDRPHLVNRRFDQFVGEADRERWQGTFVSAMANGKQHKLELNMKRGGNSLSRAYLDCRRVLGEDKLPCLRIAIMDMGEPAA